MSPVFGFLIMMGGLALLGCLVALFAYVMDQRSSGNAKAKKQLAARNKLIHQIEDECMNQIAVNQYDLTANRVSDLIRKNNRELSK